MRQYDFNFASFYLTVVATLASCTTPNPNYRPPRDAPAHDDAMIDGSHLPSFPLCTASQALRCDDTELVSCNGDGTAEVKEACANGCNPTEKRCASKPGPVCTANQALRCNGDNLVRCNADGSGEATQACSVGCDDAGKRCKDIEPSNGLGQFFALAASQGPLDLGASATINTDTGEVKVDGNIVTVQTATLVQNNAPTIRVLMVGRLTARDVVVIGTNALAVVSNADIVVSGVFAASAVAANIPGAGAYHDGACRGQDGKKGGGAGGGGFGSPGGSGGTKNLGILGSAPGSAGGTVTGTATLVPLRGGCDGGAYLSGQGSTAGGGGAIQLVSRSSLIVSGRVAANGAGLGGGGGSGGGILLEAPVVELSGAVVANGGGGGSSSVLFGGLLAGESGRFDAVPATGWRRTASSARGGGDGAAGTIGATNGTEAGSEVYAGSGGGGVGRIRVNTAAGGFRVTGTGIYSPNPSSGTLGVR